MEWGDGNHPRAAVLLGEAVAGLRSRHDPLREWMGRLMLADALGSAGDVAAAAQVAEGFDEPAARGGGPFAAATAAHVAMMLAAFARYEESDQIAMRARRHPHADAIASVERIRLAFIDTAAGNLDATVERLRAAFDDTEREDPFNLRLYVGITLAVNLDERGDADEAVAVWTAIAEQAGETLAPFVARENHDFRAKVHARYGRLREAEWELAYGGPIERGWRAFAHHLAHACLAALRGDVAETLAATERTLEAQRAGPPLVRLLSAADLVPALAAVGKRRRGIAVIDEAMDLADRAFVGTQDRFPRGRLLALRAWLRHGDGDQRRADDDLDAMWREAGEARRFILRRDWEHLRPLIWSALERRRLPGRDAVEAIAAAFPEGAPLVEFAGHPVPEVRHAALGPAIASGHPDVLRRLPDLISDADPSVAASARRERERLAEAAFPLHFRLLGDFVVRRGKWRIEDEAWDRPAAAKLVRFLLLERPDPVPADEILESLWPKIPPDRARASLHVAVSRARGALDLPGAEGSVLASVEGGYRLELGERDTVDAESSKSRPRPRSRTAERGVSGCSIGRARCGEASRCRRSAMPSGRSHGASGSSIATSRC